MWTRTLTLPLRLARLLPSIRTSSSIKPSSSSSVISSSSYKFFSSSAAITPPAASSTAVTTQIPRLQTARPCLHNHHHQHTTPSHVHSHTHLQTRGMKTRSSVKRLCDGCKVCLFAVHPNYRKVRYPHENEQSPSRSAWRGSGRILCPSTPRTQHIYCDMICLMMSVAE